MACHRADGVTTDGVQKEMGNFMNNKKTSYKGYGKVKVTSCFMV